MELSHAEWAKAETIARQLALDVDRNELGKVVAYAKHVRDAGKVMELLGRLPQSGYVRSGRTRGYLERIASALRSELAGLEGDRALVVLAWAFRLLTLYQTERGTRKATGRGKSRRRNV
jgi:hypothetical protein